MPYQGRQPGVGVRDRFIFTATTGQTSFSGNDSNGLPLKYDDAAYVDVFINGTLLVPVTDYTATTKTSVVLIDAAAANDVLEILAYGISSIADTVSASSGGTFAADVTFAGGLDVDGTTNLDVVDIDGAVNMATTALVTGVLTTTAATVFNGGFAANAASTITTSSTDTPLSLVYTGAAANVGPVLDLYRNSASPADSDVVGRINFKGENSAGESIDYAYLTGIILDVTDGTEDGYIAIRSMLAGSDIPRITMDGTETVINDGSADLNFRVESNGNANMLFVDGGEDAVGIGTIPPAWRAGYGDVGFNVGVSAALYDQAGGGVFLVNNWYRADDNTLTYRNTNEAQYIAMDAGIFSFQTAPSGSAGAAITFTETMKIDATGAVTKPLQPAFLAKVASAQNNLANYVNVLIFGTEIFDQNADFNPSNGIFTAPVTGKYMLSTFIGLDQIPPTGTGVLQLQIAASNRTVLAAFDPIVFDAVSTKYTFTQSLLVDMDAGDTAKIQVYMPESTSTIDINLESYFSGYLAC